LDEITLRLKEPTTIPIEADSICPDHFVGVVEGDLRHVKKIGQRMTRGRITVRGDVGLHLGAYMSGGEITVEGNAGDWAGAHMQGGRLWIKGNAGHLLGAAYRGEKRGVNRGVIVVEGDAGREAGAQMRRGLIVVLGDVGDFAGARMIAGSIFVFGRLGARAGAGMKRGTIVAFGDHVELLPTFRYECRFQPVFLRYYLLRLREWKINLNLNERASAIVRRMVAQAEVLGAAVQILSNGATVIDAGIEMVGSLAAGQLFAEACLGGLGEVGFTHLSFGDLWLPGVSVRVEHPAIACMAAQYAGWAVKVKSAQSPFFAMGSGPARALYASEPLFERLSYRDQSGVAVLLLEGRRLPGEEVAAYVAARCGVDTANLTLVIAPTASLVGSVQVAARVVETGLHKLTELGFDVEQVVAGFGTCPLAPVSGDDLKAIGLRSTMPSRPATRHWKRSLNGCLRRLRGTMARPFTTCSNATATFTRLTRCSLARQKSLSTTSRRGAPSTLAGST